jgi:predicted phosphodiesterase
MRMSCCVALVLMGLVLNSAMAAEPLYRDDFKSLDKWDITTALSVGPKLAVKGPRWTLADGWLRPVRVSGIKEGEEVFHVALAKWDAPADCTVRCRVRRQPGQGPHGIVFRAKDASNCLVACVTTLETIELLQFVDGKERELASVHGRLPPGEGTIEVQAYGPQVKVVLNGMEALSYDKAPAMQGRCGLFSASSAPLEFTRFSVWERVPPVELAAPRVLKKAYLLTVTRDSARILWETLTPMNGTVLYSESAHTEEVAGGAKTDFGKTTMHDVTINGLKPGTKYSFKAESYTAESGDLSAGEGSFTTDPGPGVPFRVGVLSDTHFGDFTKAVTERVAARGPQIVIHTGDSINYGKAADEWEMDYFGPAEKLLASVPMYTASGNHDASGFYWSRRYLPYAKGTDRGARYFAFQYGNARFVVLTHYDTPITPGSPQHKWLVQELQSPEWKAARWRFVYYHQPPYSAGWKGWETGGDLDIRRHVLPLLEKAETTMVLSGHTHSHERGYLNGVVHIINGSLGTGEDWGRNWPMVQYHRIVPHYSMMDITDDRLTFTAYDMGEKVLDRFVLEHGKPFDLPVGPTVVKAPEIGEDGWLTVTLKCPELGSTPVRYRVVLDERRSEDGFWAPSEQSFPADQEAKLTMKLPAARGMFTVKCQVLTADMLRPGKWVEAGVVDIAQPKH